MRSSLIVACALLMGASSAAAQSIQPKVPPQLPNPLADTVIVSSLALAGGATTAPTGPVSLNHVLLGGKKPSHYRVSKYADFKGASWINYPTTVPTFSSGDSGACSGSGLIKIVAHFQVRAPKVIGNEGTTTFVVSNVARDTTCMMISG